MATKSTRRRPDTTLESRVLSAKTKALKAYGAGPKILNKGIDARPEPSYYELDRTPSGQVIINVPMIHWNDFFVSPNSDGHLGVLFFPDRPNVKFGELLQFTQFGEVIVYGVVVGIERPGHAMRDDCAQKSLDRWKLHWVPTTPKALNEIAHRFSKILKAKVKAKGKDGKKSSTNRRRK